MPDMLKNVPPTLHVVRDALSRYAEGESFTVEVSQSQAAAAVMQLHAIDTPESWMRWCDHRMLERCEAAEARVERAERTRTAAPELLAELKEKICAVDCACCATARAAIAKAEGR